MGVCPETPVAKQALLAQCPSINLFHELGQPSTLYCVHVCGMHMHAKAPDAPDVTALHYAMQLHTF